MKIEYIHLVLLFVGLGPTTFITLYFYDKFCDWRDKTKAGSKKSDSTNPMKPPRKMRKGW